MTSQLPTASCPLCATDGGTLLWRDAHLRVIAVDDPDYPGYTRVVWHDHVAEMTSLPSDARQHLMQVVYAVEDAQRAVLQPTKINLAAFGNMVPHLHWHIIPRWQGDRHFPDAVWAPVRVVAGSEDAAWHDALAARRQAVSAYQQTLVARLEARGGG